MNKTTCAIVLKPEAAIHVFSADERQKLATAMPWKLQSAIAEFDAASKEAEKQAQATAIPRS